VEVLTDPRTTSREIKAAIEGFIENYGKDADNRLVIYFAGHGHTGKSGDGRALGYVVPSDAPPPSDDRRFRQTAISMGRMEAYAKEIESRQAMFVFDSCFSGTFFTTMREFNAPSPNLEDLAGLPVRFFITAGTENQRVPDRSLFRRVFVAGLDGKADTDGDGFVTGMELGIYVRKEVTNFTKAAQTPQYGKIFEWELARGDLVFALSRAPRPLVGGSVGPAQMGMPQRDLD
jgi:hypothetical protein